MPIVFLPVGIYNLLATYTYKGGNGRLKKITYANGDYMTASYNTFGRKEFDEIKLGSGFVSRKFSYLAGEVRAAHTENDQLMFTPTTNLVSEIVMSDGHVLSYTYDAEERITKVTDTYLDSATNTTVSTVTDYTYDALGQLLTETRDGVTVNTMSYDNYGNITSKNGISYTYDATWKDLLTSYNGQSITYDAQGNPTTYLGHTLTWEKGRQLKSFDTNTYTYNANGIRTSKTVGGVTHNYLLDGAKILRETWGDNTLVTLWDNEDSICGIKYNGASYYFLKNLQGDIIAITDNNGAVIARYSYDAWGACTIDNPTSADIATINPFRYRGYYYDAEIGLYYLQSRYYNPVVSRFVNVDEAEIVEYASSILKFNLYGYCVNSPTNYLDYMGFSAALVIGGITITLGQAIFLTAITVFAIGYLFDKAFRDAVNTLIIAVCENTIDAVGYLTNVIADALEKARKGKRYSTYEVHHIVAHDDIRAIHTKEFIEDNGCDVEKWYNKVSIKKQLHKHLHTNAYFAAVDMLLRTPTLLIKKDDKERKKSIIISELIFIGIILRAVSDTL